MMKVFDEYFGILISLFYTIHTKYLIRRRQGFSEITILSTLQFHKRKTYFERFLVESIKGTGWLSSLILSGLLVSQLGYCIQKHNFLLTENQQNAIFK